MMDVLIAEWQSGRTESSPRIRGPAKAETGRLPPSLELVTHIELIEYLNVAVVLLWVPHRSTVAARGYELCTTNLDGWAVHCLHQIMECKKQAMKRRCCRGEPLNHLTVLCVK
jgi:hypothetical protein